MITNVSYSIDEKTYQVEVPKDRFIQLRGSDIQCDNFISIVERAYAGDLSGYYTEFDNSHHVRYTVAPSCIYLNSDEVRIVLPLGGDAVVEPEDKIIGCLRYISDGELREFYTPVEETKFPLSLVTPMVTHKSQAYASYLRYMKLFNNLVGYEALSWGADNKLVKSFKLDVCKFSIEEFDISMAVMYNCFALQPVVDRVLLLSRIAYFSERNFTSLLNAVKDSTGVKNVIFTNNVSSSFAYTSLNLG